MRIAHVITGLTTGGAERVLQRLLESSDRTRFVPSVISLMDMGAIGPSLANLGIPVSTLNMRRGIPVPANLLRLRRILRASRPDIVQGWMYHGNIAALAARPRDSHLVWGIHQSLQDIKLEKPLTQTMIHLGRFLSRRTDAVIYCSERSAAHHFALGYTRSGARIIANGVDTAQFHPRSDSAARLRSELNLPSDALIVGHAARFHPMKNHRGLIQAFAKIASKHKRATLVLAGADINGDNQELTSSIQSSGAAGRIKTIGERPDMHELMPAFNVYVSASGWGEAMPMVLLEAMASGVPCVATDVGDSARLLAQTGTIVEPGDVGALVSALEQILNLGDDERKTLGEAARRRATERFSLERMEAAYAALYDELQS